jgi:glutamate formiminotransferase/formiminotetrahydrofolate cyclodeaminase
MTHLVSLTVEQLLDALASTEPLPAGGSASALAGAAGASLLLMAAAFPKTKSGSPREAEALAAAAAGLRPVRRRLTALVDEDSEAYARVLAARRLPRGTPDEQAQRRHAVAGAMRLATEVPLETMRAARSALGIAVPVAASAARAVSADAAVALELLLAAVRGAGRSVAGNLSALDDPGDVGRIDAERRRLEMESEEDAAQARAAL